MKPVVLFLFGIALFAALFLIPPDQASASSGSRFIVVAPHTKEQCLKALDDVKAMGNKLLEKCDWGCMAGDHTCYVVLEGKDEAAVRKMLPGDWSNATVQKLNKFTAAQIASFHKK